MSCTITVIAHHMLSSDHGTEVQAVLSSSLASHWHTEAGEVPSGTIARMHHPCLDWLRRAERYQCQLPCGSHRNTHGVLVLPRSSSILIANIAASHLHATSSKRRNRPAPRGGCFRSAVGKVSFQDAFAHYLRADRCVGGGSLITLRWYRALATFGRTSLTADRDALVAQ